MEAVNLQTEQRENLEQYRVVITKEASKILENLLAKVRNGFDNGDINKSDIANFIILDAEKTFSESGIRTLRTLHFDEKKMLAAILKTSRIDGELPEPLRKAVREHFGLIDGIKKQKPRDQ